ncbi:ubiquinone-binding protein [Wolbachia pipientis]|uniref:Ubiquinone-binding protein n=1 Tax=Wolbachia pipientis TaxID=955 RepID=A0A1E7QKC9_WOLPI|nr:type II toxin-antitoxin system RatA family toxin [Wolbachia pipientis]OEY86932.1 ubiquinone-binding protein [Wolbachia pipientis]
MLYQYRTEDIFLCSLQEAFQLVIDVEKYPHFIPWCKVVHIKEKTENQMIVDLLAVFYGIKGQYTSEVISIPPNKSNLALVKVTSSHGIFKYLYNEWQFIYLDEYQTIVKFYIEFKFKSNIFSMMLNQVYKRAQSKIITAFKNRAEKIAQQKLS